MTTFDTYPIELMQGGTPPLIPRSQQIARAKAERDKEAQKLSLGEQAVAAIDQGWIKSFGIDELFAGKFPEDPSFELTEDMVKAYGRDLPHEDWPRLADARSLQHLEHISTRLREIRTTRTQMSEAGWTGTALSIGTEFVNPITLATWYVGGAAGGALGLLSRAERTSALVARGLIYAGAGAAEVAYRSQYDPDIDDVAVAQAAMIGLGFGALEGGWKAWRAYNKLEAMELVAAREAGLKLTPRGEAIVKSVENEAVRSGAALEREILSNPDVAEAVTVRSVADVSGTTTPRATAVVPEVPRPSPSIIESQLTKAKDWADKAEAAIKARQAARAIPRGENVGGTIIFDEIIDGLELAVVKAVRAGAVTAEAVRKTVAEYIASHKDLTPEQRSALESRGKTLETELDDVLKPDVPTGRPPPPDNFKPGDFDVSDLADANVPHAAMPNARIGTASYLGSDASNEVRKFGIAAVNDPLMREGGMPTREAATRHVITLMERHNAPYFRDVATAFDDFAARNGAKWWHPRRRADLRRQFNETVTDTVEFGTEHTDPAINRAADAARKLIAEARNIADRYGIPEFKSIAPDSKFVPHILNQYQTNKFTSRFGWDQTVKLVRASLVRFEGVDERILDNIAKGWLARAMESVNRTAFDATAIFKPMDAEKLATYLKEIGLEAADIKDVLARMGADDLRPGVLSRAMHRTSFNMETTLPLVDRATGEVVDASIKSLFVRDIDALMHLYTRQLYGEAVLHKIYATMKSERPITTMEGLMDHLKQDMLKSGTPLDGPMWGVNVKAQQARIGAVLNQIKGIPDDSPWSRVSRSLLDLGYVKSGGMFGLAQASEDVLVLQRIGVKAAFDTMPQIPAIIRSVRNQTVNDALVEELASLGHGAGMLVRRHVHEVGGSIAESHGIPKTGIERVLGGMRRGMSVASGLQPLTDLGEMIASVGVSNRWIRYAKQNRLPSKKRLAAIGLNETQARQIIDEMRKPGVIEAIHGTDGKGKRLNLDAWDPQVRADFTNAIEQFVRNSVQRTDIGQMSAWMTTPLGHIALQFRTFAVGAWEEQLLRNVQQKDLEAATYFVAASALGALQTITYIHLLSLGRKDRDEFLKERLTLKNIALGAFNRTGWSSVTPMFADAVSTFFGYKPAFNQFRPSGVEDSIFGNPTAALAFDVARAGSGFAAVVDPNRSVTQGAFNAMRQVTPYQNFPGIAQGLNAFQTRLPRDNRSASPY